VSLTVAIVSASTLVQAAAALVALRLVRVTGRRRAWWLVAGALALMAVRRAIVLYDLVAGHVQASQGLFNAEVVALAISLVMLAGIAMIGPVFRLAGADVGEARRLADGLGASERRLRTVLDAVPEAFLVVVDGRVAFASGAAQTVLGVAPADAVGRSVEELGGAALADAALAEPPAGGAGSSWDLARTGVEAVRGGVPVPVDVLVRLGSWDGRPARICLVADATERRRAREALDRERGLFAAGPVVLLRWGAPPGRHLLFVTDNGRLWGFDPGALPGRMLEFHELVHPDDRERVRAEAAAALAAGRASWSHEYRLECPDGVERWVFDVTLVARDASGEARHFDGYLLDITDRKRTEAALAASEERFRLAAGAVQEVIFEWDVASDRMEWWSSAPTAVGWPVDELPGAGREHAERVHKEDVAARRAVVEEALAGDEGYASEYRYRRRDGSWGVVVERAQVVPDGRSSRRIVGALLDLSERRRLEEQLNLSRRLEAVGSLAGGVAHDFNNLLTAIVASVDLLQLSLPPGAGGRDELRTIKDAARRAADLTRALLAFARRQVLQPVDLDLDELVDGFLPMLRRVVPESVRIERLRGAALDNVHVDRSQVEQILMNLCLNSRDAMRDGGTITIATDNAWLGDEYVAEHPWAAPGRYVLLSVSDTGQGMDEGAVRHAFEPFYTTKRLGRAAGLGLPTAYGIVKQHAGLIDIESAPGVGTSVRVYLPAVAPRESTGGVALAPEAAGGSETILVVEDDAGVRRSTVALLTRLGYTVLEAADGVEALAMLEDAGARPDLVLSDVVMPRMGGRELAERAAAVAPGILFLLASGYPGEAVPGGTVEVLGAHFIAKPYGLDTLARTIRGVLDRRGGGS